MRVWVDDRHPIFRHGVNSILTEHGFSVVGESSELIPEPDLSGVDVLIFEADSHTLGRALRMKNGSTTRLVVMVPGPNERLVADAIAGGASAVLLRPELSPMTLVGCLRTVAGGNTALPESMLPRLMEQAANGANGNASSLSERELAVLGRLAEGEEIKEIAQQLAYSERTVKNIVHDVLVKLNCRNRAHAVALATRRGLI